MALLLPAYVLAQGPAAGSDQAAGLASTASTANAANTASTASTAATASTALAATGAAASEGFNESGGARQVLKFSDLGASMGMAAPSDHGGFAVNRDFLRGFPNESALRNGFRDFGYLGLESQSAREGVEVFKGPASALYGNGKPGGDLNVLTRRADGVRRRDLQLSLSRHGFRTLAADLGTAASDDVALRLGLSAEGGGSLRQYHDFESYALAPSMAWRLSGDTRITLEADLMRVREQIAPDRLPYGPLLAFPERRTMGRPGDWLHEQGSTWRLALEHNFSPDWHLRQALFVQRSHMRSDTTEPDVYSEAGPLNDDGTALHRVGLRRLGQTQSEVSQTELYGHFSWAGMQHQVLAGLELGRFREQGVESRAPLADLLLAAPTYEAQPGPYTLESDQRGQSHTAVLYLQDRVRINPQWQMLLGLRAERLRSSGEDRLNAIPAEGRERLLSPRAGLVYTPDPRWSWFASLTQSSRPQLGETSADGRLLAPEVGQQLEAGMQWGQAEQGLLGTLSVYQLRRRGLATVDTRDPNFSVAGGERQSRGVELDLRGELAPGLSMDFSVEALRARVLKDSEVAPGTTLPGVSPWFASVWLTKELDARWTLGWGVVAEGRRRAGWPPNELELPAYVTTDLSLAYRADKWRLQASMGNVLARRALLSDGYGVSVVAPRSLTLTASMGF